MDIKKVDKNHPSVLHTRDINQVCAPLFQQYGLSTFIHTRVFDDGSCWFVASCPDYTLHHFNKSYKISAPIPKKFVRNKFCYLLDAADCDKHPALSDVRNIFGQYNNFYIVERYQGYYDKYYFASSTSSTQIINFYFNQTDILESFILHYKDVAAPLIIKCAKHKIILPNTMRTSLKGGNKNPDKPIASGLRANKYHLNPPYQNVYLTKREVDCLTHLARSKTAKETAQILALSPRTVEIHIANIKDKLGCYKKSGIVEIALQNNLLVLNRPF